MHLQTRPVLVLRCARAVLPWSLPVQAGSVPLPLCDDHAEAVADACGMHLQNLDLAFVL